MSDLLRLVRQVLKTRNRQATLTEEFLLSLWVSQEGRDAYTGIPMDPRVTCGPFKPSLDRIDSRLGYQPGNVCWCEWWVNHRKNVTAAGIFRQKVAAGCIKPPVAAAWLQRNQFQPLF